MSKISSLRAQALHWLTVRASVTDDQARQALAEKAEQLNAEADAIEQVDAANGGPQAEPQEPAP